MSVAPSLTRFDKRRGTAVRTAQLTNGELKQLAITLLQGVPDDLAPERVRGHIGKGKGKLHEALRLVLQADLSHVDMEVMRSILEGALPVQVAHFQPEVLERVRALGGQFADAHLTTVAGGQTLLSQRDDKVIKFWTDWQFSSEETSRLSVAPSIGSEVVYHKNLVEGSFGCTYDKVEGRLSVQDILAGLPQVEGLRWIVGNAPTVNQVLTNHLQATGEYLLPAYTWTSDSYQSPHYGLCRLLVGHFNHDGICVYSLGPDYWFINVGLFVLGVPV